MAKMKSLGGCSAGTSSRVNKSGSSGRGILRIPRSISLRIYPTSSPLGSRNERQNIGDVFAGGLGEDARRFEHLKAVNKLLQK
jgi:hypothetical protein